MVAPYHPGYVLDASVVTKWFLELMNPIASEPWR